MSRRGSAKARQWEGLDDGSWGEEGREGARQGGKVKRLRGHPSRNQWYPGPGWWLWRWGQMLGPGCTLKVELTVWL